MQFVTREEFERLQKEVRQLKQAGAPEVPVVTDSAMRAKIAESIAKATPILLAAMQRGRFFRIP